MHGVMPVGPRLAVLAHRPFVIIIKRSGRPLAGSQRKMSILVESRVRSCPWASVCPIICPPSASRALRSKVPARRARSFPGAEMTGGYRGARR